MPKSRPRFHANSHTVGELVEFIGRDFHNRGLGIVIEILTNPLYLVVFWQGNRLQETIHKAKLRRVLDVSRI